MEKTLSRMSSKALGYLKADGYIIQGKIRGFWEWIGDGVDTGDLAAPPPAVPPDDKIKVERTLGEGPESLYVYYNDSERELANLKGQSKWPCKIGKGEPIRVLNQVGTARHTLPVIALVIRSYDAQEMERLIHLFFERAGLRMNNDRCGVEWFMTNPEQVAACYSGIENLVTSFRRPLAEPNQSQT
jgi:Meiotically Up-regulated Gene 113 (MUG113) protein